MFFNKETKSALEAIEYAHFLAYAPIAFQATRALKNFGILDVIGKSGREGLSLQEIHEKVEISFYGVRVLVESGLGIGLIIQNGDKYILTKTGVFINGDVMTDINFNFVNDVCYEGAFYLEDAIKNGKPEGLKMLGNWKTIYEGLSELEPKAQKSWFDFDHFYSDDALPLILPIVFESSPKKILDIGGNTGKWSIACANYNPDVQMTIADLPGQINMAEENIRNHGLQDRVHYHPTDMLNKDNKLPKGHDIIWMSQFLDCFSEEEIISILQRCHEALTEKDCVYILEPLWDRQRFEAGAYSLQQTSLYFTTMANGNSQMYRSDDLIRCIEASGFYVDKIYDQIGVSQSLIRCKKK